MSLIVVKKKNKRNSLVKEKRNDISRIPSLNLMMHIRFRTFFIPFFPFKLIFNTLFTPDVLEIINNVKR